MMRPIKNHDAFFKYVEEGLQQYFDKHDKYWGGILHFTVGVKCGVVGGIIKGESTLHYEGYTLHRVEEILRFVLPRYVNRTQMLDIIGEVVSGLRNDADEPTEELQHELVCEPTPEKKKRTKKNCKA